jgi:hypothetical protein
MAIFISYSSNDVDQTRLRTFVKKLQQRGVVDPAESFTDVSSHAIPGQPIKAEIRSAIESASTFVLVWTEAASKSQWVNYEAGMADALGKRIVVVIPEGSAAKVPDNLKDAEVVRIAQTG